MRPSGFPPALSLSLLEFQKFRDIFQVHPPAGSWKTALPIPAHGDYPAASDCPLGQHMEKT